MEEIMVHAMEIDKNAMSKYTKICENEKKLMDTICNDKTNPQLCEVHTKLYDSCMNFKKSKLKIYTDS